MTYIFWSQGYDIKLLLEYYQTFIENSRKPTTLPFFLVSTFYFIYNYLYTYVLDANNIR